MSTQTAPYRFDWMDTGRAFSEGNEASIATLLEDIDNGTLARAGHNEWLEYQPGLSLPFCQGYAINEAIKELRLPRVSHVAHSPHFAPMGFLVVRAHYRKPDGSGHHRVDVAMVDDGCAVHVVCTRVWEGGAA